MKVLSKPKQTYNDLDIAVFMCRLCSRVYLDVPKEKVEFFADLTGNYFFMNCENCKSRIVVEVPFLESEEVFYRYVKELRNRVEV